MQYHHGNGPSPSHPAGESRKPHLRVDFDRRLNLEFHGSKITSDAGLLAYRDSDEVLGLTDLGGAELSDLRRGKNTRRWSRAVWSRFWIAAAARIDATRFTGVNAGRG